jgi:hypothetical protein
MRKPLLLTLSLLALADPAQAECDIASSSNALAASLDSMKPYEREATVSQSTEGGAWQIYREKDGRLNTIVRVDGGESGMGETRLSVVNRQTYGIASTRVDYLRHAFIEEGPFGDYKRTTTYYYFCGGQVYVPPESASMVEAESYRKEAAELKAEMLDDKDVAEFTKGLAR